MSFEDNLRELGIVGIDGKFHPIAEDELEKVEAQLKVRFPADYREFAKRFGFTAFDKDVSYRPKTPSRWAKEAGAQEIDVFYGIGPGEFGLMRMAELYMGRVPSGCIPVAEAPGGNQILLGLEGPAKGKVYFWDHESESSVVADLVLVADSFQEFLTRLHLDEEKPKGKRPTLIDFKLSDDF